MTGKNVERVRDLLAREAPGGAVMMRGWLKTARHGKERSFIEVSDGSCMTGIQVVIPASLENYDAELRALRAGCAVEVAGSLAASPGKGQSFEVHAERVSVVGSVGDDYPLQKKRHSFEFLRTIGHLRMRTNTLGAVMRVRDAAARAIRRFLQEEGFVEIHAPVITTSDCEGAGELFHVTTPEAQEDAGFFGRPAFLTVSGQLQAEIGALALTRVYTFGPTFRAENSNTSRHLAEFWMVEPEAAFLDLDGDVDLACRMVQDVCRRISEDRADDLRFFHERVDPTLEDTLQRVIDGPFERLSYDEAIGILERSRQSFEFPIAWGADLQSEHERFLTEEHVRRPVVITDWPATIKPFYMYENEDGRTVRAMDVLVPRVGELVGGSQREHRPDRLARRMGDCGLRPEDYWWYLELRRHGSAPHAGFGLGFERLIQLVTGMANIRDVIPFPRVPGSAEF